MEFYERIRLLRKDILHLSQTAFGECLGVSRSVINNIERNVLAKPEQKLSLIKLMCKEFDVSEEWLLHGTEPMYIESDTFSLDDFVKKRNASELELEIIKAYFELEPDIRKTVVEHFKKKLAHQETSFDDVPDTPEELEKKYPPVEDVRKDIG